MRPKGAEVPQPVLPSFKAGDLDRRSSSLKELSKESLWRCVPMRKRSIARKKHEELRFASPPRRSLLDVSDLHGEAAFRVGDRFPDRIVFGVYLEWVYMFPHPQHHHHRLHKR